MPVSETADPYFSALAAGAASLPSEEMLLAPFVITADDLANLHDTPVELVAAPGAGRYALPLQLFCESVVGLTPYDSGSNLAVSFYDDDTRLFDALPLDPLLWEDTDPRVAVAALGTMSPTVLDNLANRRLCLQNEGDPMTGGDGSLKLWLQYLILG